MIKPSSFEELRNVLRPYSRRLSNNYFLATDIKRLIETGCLFYTANADAVYLYERRDGYFKLFFQLNNTYAKLPDCDEPLVVYVVYRESNRNEEIEKWLKSQGFTLETEQIHLVADKLEAEPSREGVVGASREEAKELFYKYFGAYRADLPLEEHCGEFIAIRGDDGTALGVFHCGNPPILAVRENARRQRIGMKLYAAHAASRKIGPFKHWTDADNFGAQRLFSQLGFVPDGLKSACFIKK